jgi:transposase-like protein
MKQGRNVSHEVLDIRALIDDAKCFETVRERRWPHGVRCAHCGAEAVVKHGRDETQPERQRYHCRSCGRYFDDLTGTIFAGHHQPLAVWMLCLYFMGLNLSNRQIAKELELNPSDVQHMTRHLRQGVVARKPAVTLDEAVECDEVYVVAGHKGHPAAVRKKGRKGRRNRLKGARGRGTLEKEKPPIFGMIQRGGEVVIRMLANVKQQTIMPLIQATVAPGTMVFTDEYDIYNRLAAWGYEHKSVCHSRGEYARDEDGDGFHEVHVNTMEGFWSLLRSWLRPHRGISQESLPDYLGFFEFVHNAKQRGKRLLDSLLQLFLTEQPGIQ